jgi:hypothetical protein
MVRPAKPVSRVSRASPVTELVSPAKPVSRVNRASPVTELVSPVRSRATMGLPIQAQPGPIRARARPLLRTRTARRRRRTRTTTNRDRLTISPAPELRQALRDNHQPTKRVMPRLRGITRLSFPSTIHFKRIWARPAHRSGGGSGRSTAASASPERHSARGACGDCPSPPGREIGPD